MGLWGVLRAKRRGRFCFLAFPAGLGEFVDAFGVVVHWSCDRLEYFWDIKEGDWL